MHHSFPTRPSLLLVLATGSLATLGAGCSSGGSADTSPSAALSGGAGGGAGNFASGGAGGSLNMGGGSGSGGSAGTGSFGTGGSGFGGGAGAGSGGSAGAAGGSNVSFGGSEDFGYFRKLLDAGQVPHPTDFDSAGFFAEHYLTLPPPSCGETLCLQPMLGVIANPATGATFSMLQVGLNSPIVADPANRPPLSLTVVVDISGSMNTDLKINYVRQGLALMLDGLKDTDRFALVTYSTDVAVPYTLTDVGASRAAIKATVSTLTAAGSTNLYGGLERGYLEANAGFDGARQNRVILLTDGMPTVGITDTPSILAMSKGYNSDGIGLTSIGLGVDFNAELMRNLALQADGNFYFLEDSGAVSDVFAAELSYFTVPIGYDVSINVHSSTEYTLRAAYGSPFWQSTASGGGLTVPSVFVAHRQSANDTTPNGGRRGGGSALLLDMAPNHPTDDGSGLTHAPVAQVELTYRDPASGQTKAQSVTVDYPLAPWVTPPEGVFDSADPVTVQKSYIMLTVYLELLKTCTAYWNNGNMTSMLGEIARLNAALADFGAPLNGGQGDADITADIALLSQLSGVLVTNGVLVPADPQIPSNPWPAN